MIEYIYLVKCPDRTEEPFDFFEEAKAYALGCLNNKPIITQIEVDRNDFGECTDSHDLGTIWSWETMMSDIPDNTSELLTFSKDDIQPAYDADQDPEFLVLDDSFKAAETEALEMTADELMDKHGTTDVDLINAGRPEEERVALKSTDMSIDDLVEALEENEDYVECKECYDLVEKAGCVKGAKGYLCKECAELTEASLAGIASAASDAFDDHYTEQDLLDFAGIEDLDSFEDDTRSSINWEEPFSKYKMMRDAKARNRERARQQAQQRPFRKNNGQVDEAVSELTEAKIKNYPFIYLRENPAEAKQAILDQLLQKYDIDFTRWTPSVYYTNFGQMEILDFNITSDGYIKIKARPARDKTSGEYEEDLADALDGLRPGSGRVLKLIRDIAVAMKPDVRTMNTFKVMANIDADTAKEFAKYISKITFRVPLLGIEPYSKDFVVAKAGKDSAESFLDLSEEAMNKLENIYDSFLNLPFINNNESLVKSLVDEGIVKNRPSTEDTNGNIARRWWIAAYINFKCPIKELPKHLLDTIYLIKGKDKRDMDDAEAKRFENPNTVCSAHLASALIQRMDNDIKFYEHANIELSYTTDDKKELATV